MNRTDPATTPWQRVYAKFGMSQSDFARALNRHRSKVSRALSDDEGLIGGRDQKLILAVYPVIPLMLVTLLTLYAIRVVPPNRGREVITALSLLLALGVNLVNVLVNPAFQGRAPGYHVPRGIPDLPAAASPWLPFGWAGRGEAAAAPSWRLAVASFPFGVASIDAGREFQGPDIVSFHQG